MSFFLDFTVVSLMEKFNENGAGQRKRNAEDFGGIFLGDQGYNWKRNETETLKI